MPVVRPEPRPVSRGGRREVLDGVYPPSRQVAKEKVRQQSNAKEAFPNVPRPIRQAAIPGERGLSTCSRTRPAPSIAPSDPLDIPIEIQPQKGQAAEPAPRNSTKKSGTSVSKPKEKLTEYVPMDTGCRMFHPDDDDAYMDDLTETRATHAPQRAPEKPTDDCRKPTACKSAISALADPSKLMNELLKTPFSVTVGELLGVSRKMAQLLSENLKMKSVNLLATGDEIGHLRNGLTSESEPESPEAFVFGAKTHGLLISVNMECNGSPIRAIIDTGSELNVVRTDIYRAIIQQPLDVEAKVRMNDVNRNQSTLQGLVQNIGLRCGAVATLANMYVADNVPFAMLLGRPWQRGNLVSIDERTEGTYLMFKEPTNPNQARFELWVRPPGRAGDGPLDPMSWHTHTPNVYAAAWTPFPLSKVEDPDSGGDDIATDFARPMQPGLEISNVSGYKADEEAGSLTETPPHDGDSGYATVASSPYISSFLDEEEEPAVLDTTTYLRNLSPMSSPIAQLPVVGSIVQHATLERVDVSRIPYAPDGVPLSLRGLGLRPIEEQVRHVLREEHFLTQQEAFAALMLSTEHAYEVAHGVDSQGRHYQDVVALHAAHATRADEDDHVALRHVDFFARFFFDLPSQRPDPWILPFLRPDGRSGRQTSGNGPAPDADDAGTTGGFGDPPGLTFANMSPPDMPARPTSPTGLAFICKLVDKICQSRELEAAVYGDPQEDDHDSDQMELGIVGLEKEFGVSLGAPRTSEVLVYAAQAQLPRLPIVVTAPDGALLDSRASQRARRSIPGQYKSDPSSEELSDDFWDGLAQAAGWQSAVPSSVEPKYEPESPYLVWPRPDPNALRLDERRSPSLVPKHEPVSAPVIVPLQVDPNAPRFDEERDMPSLNPKTPAAILTRVSSPLPNLTSLQYPTPSLTPLLFSASDSGSFEQVREALRALEQAGMLSAWPDVPTSAKEDAPMDIKEVRPPARPAHPAPPSPSAAETATSFVQATVEETAFDATGRLVRPPTPRPTTNPFLHDDLYSDMPELETVVDSDEEHEDGDWDEDDRMDADEDDGPVPEEAALSYTRRSSSAPPFATLTARDYQWASRHYVEFEVGQREKNTLPTVPPPVPSAGVIDDLLQFLTAIQLLHDSAARFVVGAAPSDPTPILNTPLPVEFLIRHPPNRAFFSLCDWPLAGHLMAPLHRAIPTGAVDVSVPGAVQLRAAHRYRLNVAMGS
ncbi:hypothetical protein DENSPDRAFT_848113 [Dentipellis sp. KUC8613]|nr:hypothetical protein DENSPDRAFT_848113 [Dentipellis sp. KUC8613]